MTQIMLKTAFKNQSISQPVFRCIKVDHHRAVIVQWRALEVFSLVGKCLNSLRILFVYISV